MISSEVERTLVKSPPELWTELSNPDALARHLGEFGEIRITRVEPEHAVEWQAKDTAGRVHLKASGWGTKVTLTATREVAAPERPVQSPADDKASPGADPRPQAEAKEEAGPLAPAPEPNRSESQLVSESPAAEPLADPEPEPRVGLLRWLFGGRRRRQQPVAYEPEVGQLEPAAEGSIALAAVGEALSLDAVCAANPFSAPCVTQAADISAQLEAAEEVAAEEVTAVLTSVLDRLGAAHHRPFSRA
jgi:hypothetical protein